MSEHRTAADAARHLLGLLSGAGVDPCVGGCGRMAGRPVRCESAAFALRNRAGYPARDCDRHDMAILRGLLERAGAAGE